MIQPNTPFASRADYAATVCQPQPSGTGSSHEPSDETAFRAWLTRREAARSQIRRLSRRELQVVSLVASGLANKGIAQELEISVKTIEKHRANAARKLGVGSTAELVRLSVLADQDLVISREQKVGDTLVAPRGVSRDAADSLHN